MKYYLYNGVEAPELPEWDNALYPYATLAHDEGSVLTPKLYVSKSPPYVSESDNVVFSLYPDDALMTYYNNETGAWRDKFYKGPMGFGWAVTKNSVFWSNTDILNEDGSVYLAASDPVPVLALTGRDLYRKINGQLTKLTLYKKVGGELVALDEYSAVSATAVQSNT